MVLGVETLKSKSYILELAMIIDRADAMTIHFNMQLKDVTSWVVWLVLDAVLPFWHYAEVFGCLLSVSLFQP